MANLSSIVFATLVVVAALFVSSIHAVPTCDQLTMNAGFGCTLLNTTQYVWVAADGSPSTEGTDGAVGIYVITYYKSGLNVANLQPIVVMHGGPGLGHTYVVNMKYLACHNDKYKVIFYDQAYTGLSRPNMTYTPSSYYQIPYYSAEAETVIAAVVGTTTKYHLLGQSWGAMLAQQFLVDHPDTNVDTVILASGLPSAQQWVQGVIQEVIPQMPRYYANLLINDLTTDASYNDALNYFNDWTFFRIGLPDCLEEGFSSPSFNADIYTNMWGDTDFKFSPQSTLKSWDITHLVKNITAKTLLFYGEHDEVTLTGFNKLYVQLPNRKGARIPLASHLAHIDGVADWFPLVHAWLDNPVLDTAGTNFTVPNSTTYVYIDGLCGAAPPPYSQPFMMVIIAMIIALFGTSTASSSSF